MLQPHNADDSLSLSSKLPYGMQLIGPSMADEKLLLIASILHGERSENQEPFHRIHVPLSLQ